MRLGGRHWLLLLLHALAAGVHRRQHGRCLLLLLLLLHWGLLLRHLHARDSSQGGQQGGTVGA